MLESLLNFFVKDRSFEWKECFRIPLGFNLPSESLNGVALGDPCEKLHAFGRPNNPRPFKNNRFVYYQLGMEVIGADERVESFEFIMRDIKRGFTPCELTLTDKNIRQFLVNHQTKVAAVERFFGPPTDKESDEDWLNLMYHYDKLILDFEFGAEDLIEKLFIGWWD